VIARDRVIRWSKTKPLCAANRRNRIGRGIGSLRHPRPHGLAQVELGINVQVLGARFWLCVSDHWITHHERSPDSYCTLMFRVVEKFFPLWSQALTTNKCVPLAMGTSVSIAEVLGVLKTNLPST